MHERERAHARLAGARENASGEDGINCAGLQPGTKGIASSPMMPPWPQAKNIGKVPFQIVRSSEGWCTRRSDDYVKTLKMSVHKCPHGAHASGDDAERRIVPKTAGKQCETGPDL